MIPVTKNIPFAGNVEAWAVARLNLAYAHCIDDDTLEQWPDFFTPDGLYRITTAENQARGLPIGIIHADGQAMMRDRVLSLREANIYEPQRYRHILSEPLVTLEAEGALRARTSFMVARITNGGETDLFATGVYEDRVVEGESGWLYAERVVVLDSDRIDTLLALPI
jgi:3-phenylpropionate/cinnamic acid dioxygenase small subunit